jgi:hypothetical protein
MLVHLSHPPEVVDSTDIWLSSSATPIISIASGTILLFLFILVPLPLPSVLPPQISVALRAYTDALNGIALYNNLRAAFTAQILTAVNPSFLSALKDPDFGFGDVTPFAILVAVVMMICNRILK